LCGLGLIGKHGNIRFRVAAGIDLEQIAKRRAAARSDGNAARSNGMQLPIADGRELNRQ
jgi:hypothetical protein